MEVHNLMEELVIDSVKEIFSDENYIERAGCCNSDPCKTDVICYALSRIPPIYTTSSRGLAHIGNAITDKPQIIADITALVNEGIRQVGAHRRPAVQDIDITYPEPPLFNFPIIKGKVIDGKTFAPYSGSEITLKIFGAPAVMNGTRWSNPSQLMNETEGNFLFWPLPVKAKTQGEKQSFSLSLELEAEGYKPVRHFIDIDLTADDEFINSMEVSRILKIEPIYLFGLNEPEEIIPI